MASKAYYYVFFSSILIILLLVQTQATPFSRRRPNSTSTSPFEFIKSLTGSHQGDKAVKGLKGLKKYLHHFGYIPTDEDDDDDDFDEVLEIAIKIYQDNFNLNVTGTLTPETAAQMIVPRCSMPDIVDGKTSMGSHNRKLLAHLVSHYSFFPNRNKWPGSSPSLTYGFLNNGNLGIFTDLMNRAFTRWRTSTGRFTFSRTQNVMSANIKIGAYAGNHGDGYPFDGPNGVLAHAFAPTDGRLHFDAQEPFSFGPTARPDQIHLESVAVHEIGHSLGLGHSSVPASIMYPSIGRGQVKSIHADDTNGIRDLYTSS